jgi:hypothetical protein
VGERAEQQAEPATPEHLAKAFQRAPTRRVAEILETLAAMGQARADGAGPNAMRWSLFKRELASGTLSDPRYTAVREQALPLVRALLDGLFASQRLNAIVYPTGSRRPDLISAPPEPPGGGAASGSNLANLSGFPELVVPAGFTTDQLPVGVSFLGPAFSEGTLLGLGYAFEQRTHPARGFAVERDQGQILSACVQLSGHPGGDGARFGFQMRRRGEGDARLQRRGGVAFGQSRGAVAQRRTGQLPSLLQGVRRGVAGIRLEHAEGDVFGAAREKLLFHCGEGAQGVAINRFGLSVHTLPHLGGGLGRGRFCPCIPECLQ